MLRARKSRRSCFNGRRAVAQRGRESTQGLSWMPFACGARTAQPGQIAKSALEPKIKVPQAGDDERNVAHGEENKGKMDTGGRVRFIGWGPEHILRRSAARRERGRKISTRTSSSVTWYLYNRAGRSKNGYLTVSYILFRLCLIFHTR